MRKKQVIMFLTAAFMTTVMLGCGCGPNKLAGGKNTLVQENTTEDALPESTSLEETQPEGIDTESMNTENANNTTTSQLQLGYAVEIPKGFEKIVSEAKPNQMVEKVIVQKYNIPQNRYDSIGYYYNYVDLNGDSKDEILACIVEIDKDWNEADEVDEEKLLWISIEDENVISNAIKQEFTDADVPVYISYHMTEGYRDLILREDEDEYTLLVWNGERYQTTEEGKELPNLEGYEGQVVLTMDENYHILGSSQQN
ncbi:MAG: hypothetical protein J6A75_02850 [Lachnospiraceae bacterium]|nr:hypothetical protein [Lachnospiraceae bacterium]